MSLELLVDLLVVPEEGIARERGPEAAGRALGVEVHRAKRGKEGLLLAGVEPSPVQQSAKGGLRLHLARRLRREDSRLVVVILQELLGDVEQGPV
jgi:hypothetical protein